MKNAFFALAIGIVLFLGGCGSSSPTTQPERPAQNEKKPIVFNQKDENFSPLKKEEAMIIFKNMTVFNSEDIVIDTVFESPVVSTENNEVQFNYENLKTIRIVKKMTPGRLDSIFLLDNQGIKVARYRFSSLDETYKYIFIRKPDGSFRLVGNSNLYLDGAFYKTTAKTENVATTGCTLMYFFTLKKNEVVDKKEAEGVDSSDITIKIE